MQSTLQADDSKMSSKLMHELFEKMKWQKSDLDERSSDQKPMTLQQVPLA